MTLWFAIAAVVAASVAVAPPAAPVISCVVIFDVQAGTTDRVGRSCETRLSPASTFKIPHALVALETGVVTTTTVEKWDGTPHPSQPAWDRDHTVLSAMKPSVVWLFQRIAPRIGAERIHGWLLKNEYGNADTSGPVTEYWLNGRLRISPDEQVRFLRRFYTGELPIAAAYLTAVRSALEQKPGTVENARGVKVLDGTWPAGATLNAKTGATTIADGQAVSWLVGRLSTGGRAFIFASASWSTGEVDNLAGADAAIRAFRERKLLR
jgi:beta-lactamase class D